MDASRRRSPPRCRECGYELTGFGIGDTCPECGAIIRLLYDEPPTSNLAKASVILGSISLGSFAIAVCGLWPLVFVFFAGGVAGMACSLVARRQIRKDGYRFSRNSKTITRVGFWICAPGTTLAATVIAGAVFAALT